MAKKKATNENGAEKEQEGVEQNEQAPVFDPKAALEARLTELEALYMAMQREGVRSISDIEVKVANVRLEISRIAQ